MRRYEYLLHGTSHPEVAQQIHREGISAREGRPTVSPSLIYSFNYAFDKEKGGSAKIHEEKETQQPGTMFVVRLPNELRTHLDERAVNLTLDEEEKEIKNFSKYLGGRTKMALFPSQESRGLFTIVATKLLGRKKVEDTRKFLAKYFGEKKLKIDVNDIALKVEPTPELAAILKNLGDQIKNLETIDIAHYKEFLTPHFQKLPGTEDIPDSEIESIVVALITSTIESETTSLIRSLSLGSLKMQGYTSTGDTEARVQRYGLDEQQIRNSLLSLHKRVTSQDFFFQSEALTRYVKSNIQRLFKQLSVG